MPLDICSLQIVLQFRFIFPIGGLKLFWKIAFHK